MPIIGEEVKERTCNVNWFNYFGQYILRISKILPWDPIIPLLCVYHETQLLMSTNIMYKNIPNNLIHSSLKLEVTHTSIKKNECIIIYLLNKQK